MTHPTPFFASLALIFFVAAVPASAQNVTVASAMRSASTPATVTTRSASNARASEHAAVQLGFPSLRKPLPTAVYPVKAERFHIEGRVVVEYTVDERGRARDAHVLSGPGGDCEKEALRVLRAARFVPTLDADGQPTTARFRSVFNFEL